MPDLIASYWTIAGNICPGTDLTVGDRPLRARIEAAASAGYSGIGLWHDDLMQALESMKYCEIRNIMEDCGIQTVELEFLADWFADGPARSRSDGVRSNLFAAADALGARHLKVVPPFGGAGWVPSRLIDAFGGLCEKAARHGLLVALEMVAFSDLPTLANAIAVIAGADAANGGLLVDIWHFFRSGGRLDDLRRLQSRHVLAVEINDADASVRGTLAEDSVLYRRLCGEGVFDIPGFIRTLSDIGYTGPFGVEILSDAVRGMSLPEAACRSFESARAQFV